MEPPFINVFVEFQKENYFPSCYHNIYEEAHSQNTVNAYFLFFLRNRVMDPPTYQYLFVKLRKNHFPLCYRKIFSWIISFPKYSDFLKWGRGLPILISLSQYPFVELQNNNFPSCQCSICLWKSSCSKLSFRVFFCYIFANIIVLLIKFLGRISIKVGLDFVKNMRWKIKTETCFLCFLNSLEVWASHVSEDHPSFEFWMTSMCCKHWTNRNVINLGM